MNNEPVAWRKLLDTGNYMYFENYFGNSEPLYTHPAKTLTDEEILKTCIKFGFYDRISDPYMKDDGNYSLNGDLIEFARAILRKAQEK